MKCLFNNLFVTRLRNLVCKKNVFDYSNERKFVFDFIEYYFKYNSRSNNVYKISGKTIEDIDFYDLFEFVDHTHSKLGQQYLFNKLLSLNSTLDFSEQETLIAYLEKNNVIRQKIEKILSKLNRHEAYYIVNLFLDESIAKPKYFPLIKYLMILPLIFGLLTLVSNLFIFLLGLSIIVNLFLHYKNKKFIFLYKDSISQLLILLRCVKDLLALNIPVEDNLSLLNSLKSLDSVRNRMYVFQLEKVGDFDILEIFFILFEYIKIIFLLEPLIVFNVLDKLARKKEDIHNLFNYFGELDSCISILRLREEVFFYCKPKFSETISTLKFEDIYHPLIPNCVSNSLSIVNKSILLTGSNMAGKTTFIRSVAINTLFAQTINTCFAKEFILYPIKIFSAIRISDDLINDKSYYFEEVLTIKEMVIESNKTVGNLFLLDEIFKGTNTIERISAGKAVLSYLSKSLGNIVFVSTHDVELTDLLKDSYDLYHFTEVVQDKKIHFDYKLKHGYLSTRNAIRILEINNYPNEIIKDAKAASLRLQQIY